MREQPIRGPRKERGKEKGKKRGKKRKKERRKEPCSTPKEFSGKQTKKKRYQEQQPVIYFILKSIKRNNEKMMVM